ncbi:hypothetical protein BA895_19840 [Humibacillus sp. DSM 29435]|nr:hypothetical protein BA895_19840 [Humibacillus sp. DSM 29435]
MGFIAAIVGVSMYFSHLKEKGGAAGRAVSGVETVGRGIGWVLLRVYAAVLIFVGFLMIFVVQDAPTGTMVAGVAIGAYGLYVMFGGRFVVY